MIKKLFIFFWVFVFSSSLHAGVLFHPLKPVVRDLTNGIELFIAEDHEFPTVQLILSIKGGSVYDPQGQEGLAALAMETIRTGGTTSRSPKQVEEVLESVGASLEMGTTPEYHFASLSLLKKDLDLGLDLLFDLLHQPALDPGKFALAKKKMEEGIKRIEEEPMALVQREFPPLVYGEESAWGRRPTLSSLQKIQWKDVKSFHQNFVVPYRFVVATAGDFTEEEIFSKIQKLTQPYGKMERVSLPEIPSVQPSFDKGLKIISKKGLTQSTIVLGHLGAKRDNPDKFPLLVMNFILGGSGALTSRMGDEIRTTAGKAYAVGSDFGFGKDFGLFKAIAQTALGNTDWVIHKMTDMIREMQKNPKFTNAEIDRAKKSILRSFFFSYETRFSQVKDLARFRLIGYPDDYLEIFQKQIASVKRADLERVARKYLHPDGLKVLVFTDDEKVGEMNP